MITFVRGFIKFLHGTWTNMRSFGYGYADEQLSAKMYQHWGFKSYPPAGTEDIKVHWGNNVISIAENDQSSDLASIEYNENQVGCTILYANNILYIKGPKLSVFLPGDTTRTFDVTNTTAGTNIESGNNFAVKAPSSSLTYYLVTEKFLTDYLLHTHAVTTAPGTTGPVLIQTYPGTLSSDVTQTLKGD